MDQCCQHGQAIHTSWKRKSTKAREAILLFADPDMYGKRFCEKQLPYDYNTKGMSFVEGTRGHNQKIFLSPVSSNLSKQGVLYKAGVAR
jgi:hypothetical protein